jgi:hypothetical protein
MRIFCCVPFLSKLAYAVAPILSCPHLDMPTMQQLGARDRPRSALYPAFSSKSRSFLACKAGRAHT